MGSDDTFATERSTVKGRHWRITRSVVRILLFFLGCNMTSAVHAKEPGKFETSFTDSQFDNKFLVPTSQGNASQIRPDKDGVHLFSVPPKLVNNLGFGPRFKLRGDFEITAAFTVLKSPQPTDGFGTGAVIQLNTNSPGPATAVFGRLCRKDGGQVISTYAATGAGEERKPVTRLFPEKGASFRFRLARVGDKLTFFTAEPKSDKFRKLLTTDFDTAEVNLLRLGMQQSHADASVEVAWHELQITADELVGLPDTLAAGEKQHRPQLQYRPPESPFPWGWASATVVLATLFLGFWWWQRRAHA